MSCSFRKVPAQLEITDTAIAEEIAMSLGYVRTAPDLSAYRKAAEEALEARGEVLPGLDMKPEAVAFTLKQTIAQNRKTDNHDTSLDLLTSGN